MLERTALGVASLAAFICMIPTSDENVHISGDFERRL